MKLGALKRSGEWGRYGLQQSTILRGGGDFPFQEVNHFLKLRGTGRYIFNRIYRIYCAGSPRERKGPILVKNPKPEKG